MDMTGGELAVAAKKIVGDANGDGQITAEDCPFEPGTQDAKTWWADNVDANLQSNITAEMKAQYGDRVVGAFNGKPLVPGERGQDQGDAWYLTTKIAVTEGLPVKSAAKVAEKVMSK
jgi:hypothetical protein